MSKTRTRLVLLDAHAIIHRAYHALPHFSTSAGEPTGALFGIVSMLLSIIKELNPDDIAAAFDLPQPTHRHEVFAAYKATRKKADDDLVRQIKKSRELFAAFGIPVYEASGFEADDVLGTVVTQLKKKKEPHEIIIASGDMDTLQLVDDRRVMVYTLKRSLKETILYDQDAVCERYGFAPTLLPDYKGLRGDPSDNIPGIKGVGDKTARLLISSFGDLDSIYHVLENNEEKVRAVGITPRLCTLLKEGKEEAYFSRMLATIRTDAPVSFQLQKKPWRERIDSAAVEKLFASLEFRRMGERLASLLGEKTQKNTVAADTPEAQERVARLAIKLWLIKSDYTNPTLDDIIQFTRASSLDDAEKVLDELLRSRSLWKVWTDIEEPLMPVLARMNKTGILLDLPYFARLQKEYMTKLHALEEEIYAAAGEVFNIRSPKQLGIVLFEHLNLKSTRAKKTATGQYSTAESELEKMRNMHPVIPLLLRYRLMHKLFSTYITPLPSRVDKDGRLHTEFVQTGTTTGRLSSHHPNLQNIPIKTEEGRRIRRGFIAPKGFRLLSLDYSQIELRIAAILSQDTALKEIFQRGEDIHTAVAARVFKVSVNEVTKEMRRRAKVINFGILYGMGVHALRKNLGEETTVAEAREYLEAYFAHFKGVAQWIASTKAAAARVGYTETLFGRRRYFEGIDSSVPYIRAAAERMAINAPIQGTQADIIKIAMVRADKHITQKKWRSHARLLLQVHDEIIFEVADDVLPQVARATKEIMENVLSQKQTHGVPIVADVLIGDNWGALSDAHDILEQK